MIASFAFFVLCLFFLPFITVGLIGKSKAFLQGRIGPPILQPLFDIAKLLQKQQTISSTTTWIFRASCAMNLAVVLLIACLLPWLSFKPVFPGDDIFLLLYLMALPRFMTILSALDAGSSFGAFAASREAFLAMLSEPAIFICLIALSLHGHNTSMSTVFDYGQTCSIYQLPVWLSAALGLFLASMVDLSRMPVDDPTTHLELTMVHEAMILENSGKNLALVELSHMIKLTVLYGLIAQCLLNASTYFGHLNPAAAGVTSVLLIAALAILTAFLETTSVKLRWRAAPEFIAYALTAALFAGAGALMGGIYVGH